MGLCLLTSSKSRHPAIVHFPLNLDQFGRPIDGQTTERTHKTRPPEKSCRMSAHDAVDGSSTSM
jgi:hypothetical protein